MKKAKKKTDIKEQKGLSINPNANTQLLEDPLYTWIILEGLKKYKEGTAGKCTIQFLQHLQVLI